MMWPTNKQQRRRQRPSSWQTVTTFVTTCLLATTQYCTRAGAAAAFSTRIAPYAPMRLASSDEYRTRMDRCLTRPMSQVPYGRHSIEAPLSALGLQMVQRRGLETRREGATPTEGGMTLYLKAGPDGKSVGDCPFAHYVRMVLEEKGLEYDLKPSTQDTKPLWLIEFYDGKMPALRHRKECYVESDVIVEYLDFFFQEPQLQSKDKIATGKAEEAIAGFFPRVAKYLKHTPDGDDDDNELKIDLEEALSRLNGHLTNTEGPYLVGESVTLLDCSLAPKLYHLQTGLEVFKSNAISIKDQFPALAAYMDTMFARESFQQTMYPKEVVIWGWSNARK